MDRFTCLGSCGKKNKIKAGRDFLCYENFEGLRATEQNAAVLSYNASSTFKNIAWM